MTYEWFLTETRERAGLVSRVVAADRLMDEALVAAATIASAARAGWIRPRRWGGQ